MKAADYRKAIETAVSIATKPRTDGSVPSPDMQMLLFLGGLQGAIGCIDPVTGQLLERVGRPAVSAVPAQKAA